MSLQILKDPFEGFTRFMLTADGSALGPTIADFFGANSSLPTITNGIYELTFYCSFLKTTAGTVQWTITNTQSYTNLIANEILSNAAGIGAAANSATAGIVSNTTAAIALPATNSLTTAVNHTHQIKAIVEAGTAGNIRLRVTSSAGTVTPLRDSFYTAQLFPSATLGTFVA